MRRNVLVAGVAAVAVVLTGLAPAGAAVPGTGAAPGARLWAARYNGPGNGGDVAHSMAVSPDGHRIFVTGQSFGGQTGYDYATVAYSAGTGRRLWASRYGGPGDLAAYPWEIVVSPDGRRVFVTGSARGWGNGNNYATVAYNAAAGRQLWVARYKRPDSTAYSMAVSPDGATVFVTGTIEGAVTATIGYSAATGRQLWVSRYDLDVRAMAVSPDGATVFVTGGRGTGSNGNEWVTVAYRGSTGRRLWVSRYDGPANRTDWPFSVAVSPAAGRLFVTGYSTARGNNNDYTTIAYGVATGRRLWVSRYNGPGNGTDSITSVAVSPDGSRVFVTGFSKGRGTGSDYATVAYRAATGRQLWVSRYNGPGNGDDTASSMAVSPGGATVFVTGFSGNDYATVAYSAGTGRQLWVRRHSNGGACCVAVSPGGRRVFVAGGSFGQPPTFGDYLTIAYRG